VFGQDYFYIRTATPVGGHGISRILDHYRPHAGLGGKMVKPYPQAMNAPVREVSFLGGLLHGYRREQAAA
jgi:hypothetical protein